MTDHSRPGQPAVTRRNLLRLGAAALPAAALLARVRPAAKAAPAAPRQAAPQRPQPPLPGTTRPVYFC
jgi:hypothetical protein